MLATFMAAIEATIVATAMPRIVGELGGFAFYSWVFAAFLLAQTTTTVIYGKLADMFGRKPSLILGISLFLFGSLLCGLAWSMPSLIFFRLLQGLGAGAIQPITSTVVGDLYKLEERGKAQGLISSVWATSAVVGPLAGGIIVDNLSWAWIFWINIPIGFIAIAGFTLFLKETVEHKKRRIDYLGAALFSIAIVSLLTLLTETKAAISMLLGLGLVFLVSAFLFLRQEARAAEPMISLRLWSRRLIASCNMATLLAGMTLIGLTTVLPLYVQGVLGRSPVVAGFTLTALVVGWPLAVSLLRPILPPLQHPQQLARRRPLVSARRDLAFAAHPAKLADARGRRFLRHGIRHGALEHHLDRPHPGQRRMVDARQRHRVEHLRPQPRQHAGRDGARRHSQHRHRPLRDRLDREPRS